MAKVKHMKILTVSQMQALEHAAHEGGFTYAMMMENAGRGVADVVKQRLLTTDHQILVLVGPGNNGGDGLVAARILHNEGYQVTAYLSRKRDAETDNEYKQAVASGVPLLYTDTDEKSVSLMQLFGWFYFYVFFVSFIYRQHYFLCLTSFF